MGSSHDRAKLTCFPQFNNLPAELRSAIWRKTKIPKIIGVFYYKGKEENEGTIRVRHLTGFPSGLHVCGESRHELLEGVKLTSSHVSQTKATVFFDPSTDIIQLGVGEPSLHYPDKAQVAMHKAFEATSGLEEIKTLMISSHLFLVLSYLGRLTPTPTFSRFKSLQTLIVMGLESCEGNRVDQNFVRMLLREGQPPRPGDAAARPIVLEPRES